MTWQGQVGLVETRPSQRMSDQFCTAGSTSPAWGWSYYARFYACRFI
jgi:hypothetical protein